MSDVIFWGATGQAKVLHEALLGTEYRVVAMFDNRSVSPPLPEIPLYIGEQSFNKWLASRRSKAPLYFCTAIGGSHGRDRIEIHEQLSLKGLKPLTVEHRTSFVAADAILGDGCQILALASVCTHTRLGRNVIINTAASVGHDCEINDGVHIGPGARLAGEVTAGKYAFIGIGAIVLPHLHIGENAIVGAGAVVIKNVPPNEIVAGNPARIINK